MLQVAYALVKDPDIKTDVTLVFANTSVADIILKDLLDDMDAKHSNFHVHHVVSRMVCFALRSCCAVDHATCSDLADGYSRALSCLSDCLHVLAGRKEGG